MKLSSLFLVNGIRVNSKMVTSVHYKDVESIDVDLTTQVVLIQGKDGVISVTPFSNVKSMEPSSEWQSPLTKTAAQPSGNSSNKSDVPVKATGKQPKQP